MLISDSFGIVLNDQCVEHRTEQGHPESPARYLAIKNRLSEAGILAGLHQLDPRLATPEEVSLVHSNALIERAEALSLQGAPYLDCPDVSVSPSSYRSALFSAGSALLAVDSVMQGQVQSAFSVSRPPGHHAEYNRAMGFCIFNNVAIAAQYLRTKYKLDRVLIFDFDVHHGNGTQHIFESDPNVFVCSMHGHPDTLYPHTGYAHERGFGAGEGMTLNVPMDPGSGNEEYLRAVEDTCLPAFSKFNPQIILVSAGFDGHTADPLGNQNLTELAYKTFAVHIRELAKTCCNGKVVSLLEGGYNLDALSRSVEAYLKGFLE